MSFSHDFKNAISDIPEQTWQALSGKQVFTHYAFLRALEETGCVSQKTGWTPHHLVIRCQDDIVAILPGYIKAHSYGEYVFDWAFAEAYQQHGLPYYPKWLCGVPFTPVQGPRLLAKTLNQELCNYIEQVLLQLSHTELSGVHINFIANPATLANTRFVTRRNVQFHWYNRDYHDFGDFLSRFNARKRKMVVKERRKVAQQGIAIRWFQGDEVTAELLDAFFLSYRLTYLKRSGHHGYLSKGFFQQLCKTLPEHVRLCCAYHQGEVVATSLYFIDQDTLYGRYWGAIQDQFDFLHFELCYYQGIELAIAQQLQTFDAGAQGEHKLARGFEPVWRHSFHYLFQADFHRALQDFSRRETQALGEYFQQCQDKLPFK